MAGVASDRGPRGQLGLMTRLRWRIFVNSLRTRRGKLDLASRALVAGSLTVMGFGVGAILAIGGWATFRTGQPLILAAELWCVFAFWQLLPLFVTGFGAQTNLSSLLRFPVRFPAFALLNLTYGLSDPVSIAGTYWLAAILVGVTAAEPRVFGLAAAVMAVFAVFNVLLNRTLMAWLEPWLARRRTREILGIAFILFVLSLQFIGPISRRWGRRGLPLLHAVEGVAEALPPGLAAAAVLTASRRYGHASRELLAGLALEALGLVWLLGVRLRAQYRGENLTEVRDEGTAAVRKPVRPGWRLPGVSPAVSALFEKDLRYLARNSSVYLTMTVPLVLVLVFGLSGGGNLTRRLAIPGAGTAVFPAAVAYCLVILYSLAYNSLGYDGAGVAALFAAPIQFRDVLLAKNLLQTLAVAAEVLAVYLLTCLVFSPPNLLVIVLTVLWALVSLPVNFTAADLASLYFPRQLVFGGLRRQKAPAVALIIAFVTQLGIGVIGAAAYLLGRWAGNLWFTAAGLLVVGIVALVAYRRVLEACDGIALERREQLMGELCRHAA
jgi:ABC-2 type transport system permease protein